MSLLHEPCGRFCCDEIASFICSRCKDIKYCSQIHQREDWYMSHKFTCQPVGTRYGFQLSQVAACLEHATNARLPIVAVAIGTGAIEGKLQKIMQESLGADRAPRWYGVDPDPTSHDPTYPRDGIFLRPDAATVPDLLKSHPALVGACVLLMIWCDWNKDYDMEAVELLCPASIVSITAQDHAGGPRFRAWLDTLPRAQPAAVVAEKDATSTIWMQKMHKSKMSEFSFSYQYLTWIGSSSKVPEAAASDPRIFPSA